jgi:hypothetical protein
MRKVMTHEEHKNSEVDWSSSDADRAVMGIGRGLGAASEHVDRHSHDFRPLAMRSCNRDPEHGRPNLAGDTHPHCAYGANGRSFVRVRQQCEASPIRFVVHEPSCSRPARPIQAQ